MFNTLKGSSVCPCEEPLKVQHRNTAFFIYKGEKGQLSIETLCKSVKHRDVWNRMGPLIRPRGIPVGGNFVWRVEGRMPPPSMLLITKITSFNHCLFIFSQNLPIKVSRQIICLNTVPTASPQTLDASPVIPSAFHPTRPWGSRRFKYNLNSSILDVC